MSWAAELVGACPEGMFKAQIDPRFQLVVDPVDTDTNGTNTTAKTPEDPDGVQCFTKVFPLFEGENHVGFS